MLQYLDRLKKQKGFTLIELVVVVAIIALLTAVIMAGSLSGTTERQLSANASAESFFTACQLAFTRAGLTERQLVDYGTEQKFIEYKSGKNTINSDAYLFLEMKSTQKGIQGLHISTHLDLLMSMSDPADASTMNNPLEKYLMTNLAEYMSDSYDGYFYAQVDKDFKVIFTHFSEVRLPVYKSGQSRKDFIDSMQVTDGKVTGTKDNPGSNGLLGVCSDAYHMADTGTRPFALPDSLSIGEVDKYIKNT